MKELILNYEKDFFKKEFCDNLQNLNDRIHDEFIEYGKSGMVFDKDSIIKYLNNQDTDRNIEILDSMLKNIKEDVLMFNYITYEKALDIKALRTSMWVMEDSCWKLYFHQGTPTDLNTLD